jgi:hypothetical protein
MGQPSTSPEGHPTDFCVIGATHSIGWRRPISAGLGGTQTRQVPHSICARPNPRVRPHARHLNRAWQIGLRAVRNSGPHGLPGTPREARPWSKYYRHCRLQVCGSAWEDEIGADARVSGPFTWMGQ